MMSSRNVTDLDWDTFSGRGDPEQAYRLYRVCPGETSPELVATCGSPEAVGVALCTLGDEGEWDDCPVGILHVEGEVGKKWLLRPWLASPKNASDAGKLLRSRRKPNLPEPDASDMADATWSGGHPHVVPATWATGHAEEPPT